MKDTFQTYLVGGAIRDKLLDLPIKERDFVIVGATPEMLIKQGFRLVGKDFPVFLHPISHEEYALARTERKRGHGYKGFSCYAAPDVTLEDDLKRRDLTINAIAQSEDGNFIDPYEGRKDIKNRILRHVSPAFVEDPVRILRVARFMARFAPLKFKIAPETMQLMKQMVALGELEHLVPERVWQEFDSALKQPAPQAFIETLRQCGALAILFPAIEKLYLDFDRADKTTRHRLGKLAIFEQAVELANDPSIRFAALFCHAAHEKGIYSIQHFCKTYRVPKNYAALAELAANYHFLAHRALDLDEEGLLDLLEKTDAFRRPHRFDHFLIICEADFNAYTGFPFRIYAQKNRLLSALEAAKSVTIQELIDAGHTHADLGIKLRKLRLKAIKHCINQ